MPAISKMPMSETSVDWGDGEIEGTETPRRIGKGKGK
jgi:hypothetical protein